MLRFIANLPLEVSMDTITLAFTFSKMQFVEELELIENYMKMNFVEFLEFVGRLAFLLWDNHHESLEIKIWRLM